MGITLAGPQPTPPPPRTPPFQPVTLNYLQIQTQFPRLCGLRHLRKKLNLKVLNRAFPPADLQVSAPPFPDQNARHPLPRDSGSAPGRGLQRARRGC